MPRRYDTILEVDCAEIPISVYYFIAPGQKGIIDRLPESCQEAIDPEVEIESIFVRSGGKENISFLLHYPDFREALTDDIWSHEADL